MGTLTVTPSVAGGNTYSGGTTITKGTLSVAADSAVGRSEGKLNLNGGTLQLDGEHQRTITGNAGGRHGDRMAAKAIH
ncbi:autotransporter-associated beta strand repeat-containing protein [Burkholderia sp. JKS000303]|uniref:autotransporter-associated beta strand repeat-containing protein n=1 Tax=Burkholderia sp. JKS000303 TaxID=1938747 RepID=UPI00211D454A|nr:autotransporter-associated beta strand repeat-containing protein [Burkholderia sp. JKS000303]